MQGYLVFNDTDFYKIPHISVAHKKKNKSRRCSIIKGMRITINLSRRCAALIAGKMEKGGAKGARLPIVPTPPSEFNKILLEHFGIHSW